MVGSWKYALEKRKEELDDMENTNSFVLKKNISPKIFLIHDNGSRPFQVIINEHTIDIYKGGYKKSTADVNTSEDDDDNNDEYDEDIIVYDERILRITNFIGYFYGFDTSPFEMHNNSVLVKITNKKYIYIGSEIYSFYTDEIITDYISYMGNNNVPYPVAYSENYVFFMADRKIISRNELKTQVTVANADDLYCEFYGHKNQIDMKKVKIIQERLLI